MKRVIIFAIALTCIATKQQLFSQETYASTIKWDKWGVPHIYGDSDADVYFGLGWAQMKAHGNLILKSFGKARGRASELWEGEKTLQNDLLVYKLDIPGRAKDWYQMKDKESRYMIDAFVSGMNAYCSKNPEKIQQDLKMLLPIMPTDPIAKLQLSYHLKVGAYALQPQAQDWQSAGSNAMAIAPGKSESGNSLLLTQPHPPWFDDYLFFEAHLISPGLNIYGIGFPGSPTIAMGFNDHLGWALTFNQADAMDLIELEVNGDSYKIDNEWRPFKTSSFTIKIRVEGEMISKDVIMKQTAFGYVVEEKDGKALALRLSGLDRPFFDLQFAKMARSENLEQFEDALSMQQLPLQNIVYADKYGSIYYLYNGLIPIRPTGDLKEWSRILPADKAGSMVTEYVPFSELPTIKNPESDFVFNSNNGPWSSTYPFVNEPENYPAHIAPPVHENFDFRSTRAIKMLLSKSRLSLDDLEHIQSSTHSELADRVVEELIQFGKNAETDLLLRAATVLESWDRKMETASSGAVLFANWEEEVAYLDKFQVPFNRADPLKTPHSLSQEAKEKLLTAAVKVMEKYGRLDIEWGNVYKTNYAGQSLPGGLGLGELGSFNAGFYRPTSENEYSLLGGSAYTSIIEFGPDIKAKGLLSYGNASELGSPFRGDQLKLMVDRKLRPIWFYESEIDQNLYQVEKIRSDY